MVRPRIDREGYIFCNHVFPAIIRCIMNLSGYVQSESNHRKVNGFYTQKANHTLPLPRRPPQTEKN